MISVTQFAQYLLRLDPQRSPGRLALYNYLKHILDPTTHFTPAVIEQFYALALNYDHWQTQSQKLADDIRDDIDSFCKHAHVTDDGWHNIRHADELQVIHLRHPGDFEELIRVNENSRQKSGDRLKFIRLSETEVASLFLAAAGTLEVKVFAPRAFVAGARLQPLGPVGHLHYGANMDLLPHVRQLVQGSLLTMISFFQDENGLNGIITRGHTFQKFETFMRAHAGDNHDLFCGLKRIERAFINPQSDPYYQQIVQNLERANRLLQSPSAKGLNLQMAERTLQKGIGALKNAFPNDRLLQLLVTHLEYGIQQAQNEKVEAARSAE